MTLQEVLAAARKRGVEVSERQLKRWRDEGLVPSPTKKGLGRGEGTVVFYPADTPRRLEIIAEALDHRRSFSFVRWVMWCLGEPITDALREELSEILGKAAEDLRSALSAFEEGQANPIDRASKGRPLPGTGSLRRAVGKDLWPGVVRLMLSGLASPPRDAERIQRELTYGEHELGGAVKSAMQAGSEQFGLEELFSLLDDESGPSTDQIIAESLASLLQALQPQALRQCVDEADEAELIELRETARRIHQHWQPKHSSDVFPVHYFSLAFVADRLSWNLEDGIPALESIERAAPLAEALRMVAEMEGLS